MEPAHRSAFARVAEGLQLVVPGGSEKLGDRDTQWLRTERVGEDRGLEPVGRLKPAILADALGTKPLGVSVAELLGAPWDDELEPFRYAGEGAPVRWLHQVV